MTNSGIYGWIFSGLSTRSISIKYIPRNEIVWSKGTTFTILIAIASDCHCQIDQFLMQETESILDILKRKAHVIRKLALPKS